MTLNEYQQKAMSTCMDSSHNDMYALAGLTAEVGEINDKIAKWIRKEWIYFQGNNIIFNTDNLSHETAWDLVDALRKEIGDVLWFVSLLADRMDITLEDLAQMNLDKLSARKANGTIDGNGDGVTKEERK